MTDLPLSASPSRLWLPLLVLAALFVALLCLAPMLLLLASLVGAIGMAPDLGLILIAVPTAGVSVYLFAVVAVGIADLRLPRPVLTIDAHGIHDRRVSDRPIAWSSVVGATPLRRGGGSVLLELDDPLPTRLNRFRPGTLGLPAADAGQAFVPVRAMSLPARRLIGAILAAAGRHGAIAAPEAVAEPPPER